MKLFPLALAFLSVTTFVGVPSFIFGQDPGVTCGSGGIIYEEREPIDPTNPEDWLPVSLSCGRGAFSSMTTFVTCPAPSGPERSIIGPVSCGLSQEAMMNQCYLNATNGNDPSTTEGSCIARAWAELEGSLPCANPTCPRCSMNTSKVCRPVAFRSRTVSPRGPMPSYQPSMQPIGDGQCNIDCGLQQGADYSIFLYAYCSQYCDGQPCSVTSTRPR